MNAMGAPPWTVRTEREQVADDARPVAVVEVTSPEASLQARETVPQGDVHRSQTFTLTLYPEVERTAAEARQRAARDASLLLGAIAGGLVDGDAVLSGPFRLPVYDFEGVPVKGSGRGGPAVPYGWLSVEDAPVRPVQDPEDARRWTVVCDLRMTWWQGGRVVDPSIPLASGVTAGPPVVG